jgi:mono/diheme cytochrome c family protein
MTRPSVAVATLSVMLCAGAAAAQQPVEQGRQVYDKWCTPCHGAGDSKPGTISATALYKGSKPAVLAERTDLAPAGIRTAVRSGIYIMPRFRKTEVSDADLEAITAYLMRGATPRK